jgi:hypothetical protein
LEWINKIAEFSAGTVSVAAVMGGARVDIAAVLVWKTTQLAGFGHSAAWGMTFAMARVRRCARPLSMECADSTDDSQ